MTTIDLIRFRQWFDEYVKGFYLEDKDERKIEIIKLKKEHTFRVCKEIVKIGKELKLNSFQLLLAETIGLFHDIGRFEQFCKYGTFRDAKSENHALLGVKILKQLGVLNKLSSEEQEIIYKAIMYHNVRNLPSDELPAHLFYAKLIRDADKLDIFYVFINYYKTAQPSSKNATIELDLPEKATYSSAIINDILNNRISDLNLMHTKNDMKLMLLSWIFDINFLPTLRAIHERNYIEKIIQYLPNTEDIQRVRQHLEKYIVHKLLVPD